MFCHTPTFLSIFFFNFVGTGNTLNKRLRTAGASNLYFVVLNNLFVTYYARREVRMLKVKKEVSSQKRCLLVKKKI
uniref:Uncharacterized protein n=1 Tax=Rhipicephalus microplus TaxID=6941 RepID=A0A6M2DBE8_RHIMP